MSIKTFPPVVFITVENPGTQDEYLSVSLHTGEAIGDDDKKIAGIYRFIQANELIAQLPYSKKKRTRKTT